MDEVGWVGMPIIPTFKGFAARVRAEAGHSLGSAGSEAGSSYGRNFGARASSSIHEHLKETAKYIVGPLIGAFAVEKIGDLVGESIRAASDLEAARNRSNLIFGEAAEDVDKFGEHAAKSLGLSHLAALQAETGFGLLGQRMGLTEDANAKFSERFTKTAVDLAAFNHTDPSSTFLALQRGVAGATRGLKPYGILIDSTAIKAEALADGILKPVKNQAAIHSAQVRVLADQQAYTAAIGAHGKESIEAQKAEAALGLAQQSLNTQTAGAVGPLTQQQKMLAARKLIMAQTVTQQGQFHRSSGELYEQQRRLTASWDNAKDRLGKGLIPVATDFVHTINRDVIPAVDRASVWFEKKGGPAIHGFEQQLKPLVNSALPALGTGLQDSYKFAKLLLPVVTGIFNGFNSLPDWAQKATLIGGTAAVIGKKTGLLGAGSKALGGGLAGELATKASPVPVFVTNPGFGGAGGVAGAKGGAILGDAEAAAGATAGGGFLAKIFGRGLLGRIGGAALSSPAFISAGDAGNEQKRLNPLQLHPSDLLHSYGPGGSLAGQMPSAETLKAFNATAYQARKVLGLLHLTSTTTQVDALNASLGKSSRGLDLIGHSAAKNSATATADIDAIQHHLAAIRDKQIGIFVKDQAAFTSLRQLDAYHLQNKYFTVVQRNQIIEQAGGPGRPNAGSGDGNDTKSGNSGGGRGPMHIHLHVDKKEIAHVVLPMLEDHHAAQQHWQQIQDER